MRKALFIIVLSCLELPTLAQDLSPTFKNWYITSLNVKTSKRNTFRVSQLTSFDVPGYRWGFGQYTFAFNRELTKNWKGEVGYALSRINGSQEATIYHRLHLNGSHRVEFGRIRMQNTLQLEQYWPQLQKFSQRAVLTNKFKYYNKKWPLRMSPYIKNQVYWYQGGSEITYWLDEEDIEEPEDEDEEAEDFIEQAPNGWHRYRFTAGVRARLAKGLYASLFYTIQREFNTGLRPYRELNVPNQAGTRIKRPFNNYSLLGISLSYTIKTYKK